MRRFGSRDHAWVLYHRVPVLHLASQTPPAWAEHALAHLGTIVLDHAHCEKKAASTALSLIFRYPNHPQLAAPLSELAREELAHFELMLEVMAARGIDNQFLEPSRYGGQLKRLIRGHQRLRMIDTFIVCALIEARSCERMQLLARTLPRVDAELARIYDGLLASEARHHRIYLDLAEISVPAERGEVDERLVELAAGEAEIITASDWHPPRLHH